MTADAPMPFKALADELEIRNVIHRYALALDQQDFVMLSACFTDDVKAEYSGNRLNGGVQDLIALLRGVGRFEKTMHHVGTVVVTLTGQHAEVQSYTVAYLVERRETGAYMIARGVRYIDKLRSVDSTWRIYDRVHTVDWSFEVPATLAPVLPAQFVVPGP